MKILKYGLCDIQYVAKQTVTYMLRYPIVHKIKNCSPTTWKKIYLFFLQKSIGVEHTWLGIYNCDYANLYICVRGLVWLSLYLTYGLFTQFWGFHRALKFSLWELSIDSFNKVFIICKDDFSEPIRFYLQPILFLTPLEKEGTSMAECYIYVTENYFLKYRRRMNIKIIFTHIDYIRNQNQFAKKLCIHKQKKLAIKG